MDVTKLKQEVYKGKRIRFIAVIGNKDDAGLYCAQEHLVSGFVSGQSAFEKDGGIPYKAIFLFPEDSLNLYQESEFVWCLVNKFPKVTDITIFTRNSVILQDALEYEVLGWNKRTVELRKSNFNSFGAAESEITHDLLGGDKNSQLHCEFLDGVLDRTSYGDKDATVLFNQLKDIVGSGYYSFEFRRRSRLMTNHAKNTLPD